MIDTIEAPMDMDLSALPRDEGRMISLLLTTQGARNIRLRSQEEQAAMEAEDFWTQLEEANAIDPIG